MKLISPRLSQYTNDNMGTEYEIIFRLIFGFYVVRELGTLDWIIKRNPWKYTLQVVGEIIIKKIL